MLQNSLDREVPSSQIGAYAMEKPVSYTHLDVYKRQLIVHVRPFGDALYPSAYYPWSHLLTGTQGCLLYTSTGYPMHFGRGAGTTGYRPF